jgi:hypothetical protein
MIHTWQREFFHLAGFMIGCKMRANGGTVEGDSDPRCAHVLHGADMIGCQIGELDYGSEMHLVLREAGMLRRQRLARLARRLLGDEKRETAGLDVS